MYRPKRAAHIGLRRGKFHRCFTIPSLLLILVFFVLNSLLWILPSQKLLTTLNGIDTQEKKKQEFEPINNSIISTIPSTNNVTDIRNSKKYSPKNVQVNIDNKDEKLKEQKIDILQNEKNIDNYKNQVLNLEKSSLLYVQYTGQNKLWTLKDIIEKVNFKLGITSTVCPPLPKNLTFPLDETFKIGMIREFLGGMYHPVHCKLWENRNNQTKERKNEEEEEEEKRNVNKICSKEAEKALDNTIKNSPKYAYVMMASNHRYLDGAMVLADSIREHSPLCRNKSADIVLIISEHIKEEMFPLLQVTFDRVKIFHGLQKFAPNSAYMATFDKIYLYMLEDYSNGIIFLDADSLITDNPDFLVQLPEKVNKIINSEDSNILTLNKSENFYYPLVESEWKRIIKSKELPLLFAVGFGDYFQTGLLILRPSIKIFLDLYLEFRFGTYGYNKWQARDGLLFRACFNNNNIGELRERPRGVYHYTGTPKPWFNLERLDYSLQPMGVWMRKQIPQSWRDHLYRYEWWTRYEFLHLNSFRYIEKEVRNRFGVGQDIILRKWQKIYGGGSKNISPEVHITKYGGVMLLRKPTINLPLPLGIKTREEASRVSPDLYMWLMRFTKSMEYLHPTRAHMAKLRTGNFFIASENDLKLLISFLSSSTINNNKNNNNITSFNNKSLVYTFAIKNEKYKEDDNLWLDCNNICSKFKLKCYDSILLDTRISDCQYSNPSETMANGIIHCKKCLPQFKAGAPFIIFKKEHNENNIWIKEAEVCFFNAWTRFNIPSCNASKPILKTYELNTDDILAPVCACR